MNIQPPLSMDKTTFLAWAEGREGRYELAERRVMMMVGASLTHGIIAGNLFSALRTRLDRTRWTTVADFGVDVGPATLRYPDIVVLPADWDRKSRTTTVPALVAEVLSPSTATLDLGDKAGEYLRIENLQAYVVLAQNEAKAWAWIREDAGFAPGPSVVTGMTAALSVPSLAVELPMAELYDSLGFDAG